MAGQGNVRFFSRLAYLPILAPISGQSTPCEIFFTISLRGPGRPRTSRRAYQIPVDATMFRLAKTTEISGLQGQLSEPADARTGWGWLRNLLPGTGFRVTLGWRNW